MQARRFISLPSLLLGSALMAAAAVPASAYACDDASGVCVEGDGSWEADKRLSKKARGKTKKKNRKRKKVTITAEIEGGRGSVFIDGVYAGSNSVEGAEVRPGSHDIQVRDGSTLIAQGVLKVKRNAGTISVVFVHP